MDLLLYIYFQACRVGVAVQLLNQDARQNAEPLQQSRLVLLDPSI